MNSLTHSITIESELTNPHPLVAAAAREAAAERSALLRSLERKLNPPKRRPGQAWEPDWDAINAPSWQSYEDRGCIMDLSNSTLPLRVSIESADRALRIYDALFKACERRGMRVSEGGRVARVFDGDIYVGIRISENVATTKQKNLGLGYARPARKATGHLRIVVIGNSEVKIEDTAHHAVETELDKVLGRIERAIVLKKCSRDLAIDKKLRDEDAARTQQAARDADVQAVHQLDEEMRRVQAEHAAARERESELLAEACAWRDAQSIRAYVAHLRASTNLSSLNNWLDWAEGVADKLDPTATRLNKC